MRLSWWCPGAHSIEQCVVFKHKAQCLIDAGCITFQDDSPNERTNPYVNHESSSVNAIKEGVACSKRSSREMGPELLMTFYGEEGFLGWSTDTHEHG